MDDLAILSQLLPLRKQGKTMGSRVCPVCGESEDPHSNKTCVFKGRDSKVRWKCQACGARGDAADALALLRGMSLSEALAELRSQNPASFQRPAASNARLTAIPERSDAESRVVNEVFDLILTHGYTNEPGVMAYLQGRGISEDVVIRAAQKGIIRMLPSDPYECRKFLLDVVGEGRLRAAGFLKEGSKWPAIAFRPLVGIFPAGRGGEFRVITPPKADSPKSIRYGSLRYPWYWKQETVGQVQTVRVVEGLIDMLSVVSLGRCPESQAIMAVPGTETVREEWFPQIIERNPCVEFVLSMDNDAAGLKAMDRIEGFLDDLFAPFERELAGKQDEDWNDILKAQRFH